MQLDTLDLIVTDVPAAAAFFRDVVGLEARIVEEGYAEFAAGPVTIMLSPGAMVPTFPARGVLLHFRVDDVAQVLQEARRRGATVLMERREMSWGWESAMIQGPEEIVIDFYRPIEERTASLP